MFGLKKFLFREEAPDHLSEAIRGAVEQWQQLPAPDFQDLHFHTRYVVVDIATTGSNPNEDQILGIAATAVYRNAIRTEDTIFVDLAKVESEEAQAELLAAFLSFIGKSPLVTYHEPFVGVFLRRALKARLGVNLQANWVDLAWLLPSMFEEKIHNIVPLDVWLDAFALDEGETRRDAMANTLLLGRLFQMLLVRAIGKEIDCASRLFEESRASSFLRRTH